MRVRTTGKRKRIWVARNRYDLYPDDRDLCESQARLVPKHPGWYFGTNYSCDDKRSIAQVACEVAGVTFAEIGPDEPRPKKIKRRNDYIACWLMAFYTHGGVLARQEGVEFIYDRVKHLLTPEDLMTIPSGNPNFKRDIRWRKDLEWCHHQIVAKGWVESVSRGVWKLTPAGIEEAERLISEQKGSLRA